MKKKCYNFFTLGVFSLLFSSLIHANSMEVNISPSSISWSTQSSLGNYHLRVTGPNHFLFEDTFTGTTPQLTTFGEDGQYRYEITLLPSLTDEDQKNMQSARENNQRVDNYTSLKENGYFYIKNGTLLAQIVAEEGK